MDYQYTISDIQEKVNISQQSIYALIKKNKEFINENSIRKQRKIYYNQAVMDFFISYYCPEQSTVEKISTVAEVPNSTTQAENHASDDSTADSQLNAMQAEIDALKAEIDALHKQLDAKDAERLELLRQNGALILTLQQEKQEKMLYLPAPKKPFTEKIKTFLKNRSHQE